MVLVISYYKSRNNVTGYEEKMDLIHLSTSAINVLILTYFYDNFSLGFVK